MTAVTGTPGAAPSVAGGTLPEPAPLASQWPFPPSGGRECVPERALGAPGLRAAPCASSGAHSTGGRGEGLRPRHAWPRLQAREWDSAEAPLPLLEEHSRAGRHLGLDPRLALSQESEQSSSPVTWDRWRLPWAQSDDIQTCEPLGGASLLSVPPALPCAATRSRAGVPELPDSVPR